MSFQLNAYIGRPKGKKNARVHLYSDELGIPTWLCDWLERGWGSPFRRFLHGIQIMAGRGSKGPRSLGHLYQQNEGGEMKGERKMALKLRGLAHINCPENLDQKAEGRCRLGEQWGEEMRCEEKKACWDWEARGALKLLASALRNYHR